MKNSFRRILNIFLMLAIFVSTLPGTVIASDEITVYVSVFDYTAQGDKNASDTGIVLEDKAVSIKDSDSALAAIKTALDEEQIDYVVDSQYDYITSVNGLAEYDLGAESGWMFSVNDDFGNMGASATYPKDGDRIELHYSVAGWGADVGSYFYGGPTVEKLIIEGKEYELILSGTDGDGTKENPYKFSLDLGDITDKSQLLTGLKTNLHPKYRVILDDEGLIDVEGNIDYTKDFTFAISTKGGFFKTYYTFLAEFIPEPLPEYSGEWENFRGNLENMAVTSAKTPRKPEHVELKWAKKHSSNWSEAITPPIIVDGYLYIAKGKNIVKLDSEIGEIVQKSDKITGDIGYGMNPLTYGGGLIYVTVGSGQVQAFRADTLESVWISEELDGQTLTPISYHDGYIFTGTWNSETSDGMYFAIEVSDENPRESLEVKKCLWKLEQRGGFYWSGAYATDDFVIFGSDDGEKGSASASACLYSVDTKTGKSIDVIDDVNGDIRSSIAYDKKTGEAYFVTKGGMLYIVPVEGDGRFDKTFIRTVDLGGVSTATPIVNNGICYVGVTGGSGFDKDENYFLAIDVMSDEPNIIGKTAVPGYIQASPILSVGYESEEGKVYLYTTYNNIPGGIYMIEIEKDGSKVNISGKDIFVPDEEMSNYCICSLVSDKEGTMYYKNDSGYLMAVSTTEIFQEEISRPPAHTIKDPETEPEIEEKPSEPTESEKKEIVIKDVVNPDKTFSDIEGLEEKEAIEALASREIINGKTEADFKPYDNIKRSEFSAIIVRALELDAPDVDEFIDVPYNAWYFREVNAAYLFGIVNGVGANQFNPDGLVSREEAVTMIARTAKLIGLNTVFEEDSIRNILSGFVDYKSVAKWSDEAFSFCFYNGIIDDSETEIKPKEIITRAEFADMFYKLLKKADLL